MWRVAKESNGQILDMHQKLLDKPASYPISPWVLPGNYSVKMTMKGKIYTQPFMIEQDPRVKTSPEKMKQIHDMSMVCYEAKQKISAKLKENPSKEIEAKLNKLKNLFGAIFNILVDTDMPVTTQTINALEEVQKDLANF